MKGAVDTVVIEQTRVGFAWRCVLCDSHGEIPSTFDEKFGNEKFGNGETEKQAAFVGKLHSYSHAEASS